MWMRERHCWEISGTWDLKAHGGTQSQPRVQNFQPIAVVKMEKVAEMESKAAVGWGIGMNGKMFSWVCRVLTLDCQWCGRQNYLARKLEIWHSNWDEDMDQNKAGQSSEWDHEEGSYLEGGTNLCIGWYINREEKVSQLRGCHLPHLKCWVGWAKVGTEKRPGKDN